MTFEKIGYADRKQELRDIVSFDGRHLQSEKFSTIIPISPKEYRETSEYKARQNPDCGKVFFLKEGNNSVFLIVSDWNDKYKLSLPNSMYKKIEQIKTMIKNGDLITDF